MSIDGNLRTLEISELLQWLAHGRKTGALVIERNSTEKQIWFLEGRITGSASNDPDEHLSRLLVDRGLVDEDTMARALKLQEATQILLGRVLVTLGSLSEADLRRILQGKTEETIYQLFKWPEGRFHFAGDAAPDKPMIQISLDVTNLVLEGMHRIDERQRETTDNSTDASAMPPEVLETQIIEPITDLPSEASADTSVADADPAGVELDMTGDEAEATAQAGSEIEEPVATPPPPEEPYAETELSLEDPDSPELRGYYQTIPAKKMSRKSLYRLVGAGTAVLIALLAIFYFQTSRGPSAAETEGEFALLEPSLGTETEAETPLEEARSGSETGPVAGETTARKLRPGEIGDEPSDIVFPESPPPVVEDRNDSAREADSRARQLASAQSAAREEELRQEYESELETLRAQLEEARLQAALREQASKAEPARREDETNESAPDATESGGDRPDPVPTGEVSPPPVQEQTASETRSTGTATPPTAEPPPPAEPEVQRGDLVEPGAGIRPPRILTPPKPRYPPAARRLRREAIISVRVLVDENGEVIEVDKSSRKYGMGFDEAAVSAARDTTWQPASKDGVPVKMWVDLRIEFRP